MDEAEKLGKGIDADAPDAGAAAEKDCRRASRFMSLMPKSPAPLRLSPDGAPEAALVGMLDATPEAAGDVWCA